MDLETENRLAALLMEEARQLRLQADKEGVHVYLRQPTVRARPNSRFLSATVLGVEQANRATEINEMWRAREKELELDSRLKNREKVKSISKAKYSSNPCHEGCISTHEGADRSYAVSSSTSKRALDDCCSGMKGGLRDQELEDFLHSRAKRGRGNIGSLVDEPGPNPSGFVDFPDVRLQEEWERHILGPEQPPIMRDHEELNNARDKRARDGDACSRKHHSHTKKKFKKEMEKTKRKEKRLKHHYKR